MSHTETVTASTTSRDVFKNSPFHVASRPSRYRLYGRHAAAVGTVVASIRHGRTVDGEEELMVAAAGAPVIPDDLICESYLMPGEAFKVDLRETAGTNTATLLRTMIDEV